METNTEHTYTEAELLELRQAIRLMIKTDEAECEATNYRIGHHAALINVLQLIDMLLADTGLKWES